MSFVKNNHYFNIKSILNVSMTSREFNLFFNEIVNKFLFFMKVKKIPIIQGEWSPYCIIQENSIKKYSIDFWRNFLGKELELISKFEISVIIAYFIRHTRIVIKTSAMESVWFSTIYSNGLVEQLSTQGGYVYTKPDDCTLTVVRSYKLNDDYIKIKLDGKEVDQTVLNLDLEIISKILSSKILDIDWMERFNYLL